ncbi:MAG TPA: CYTH and CHAD domain-containing protein [Jiangellaceae bacterium]|nr:CYTH and CHAD domain-containing protein [Jiangellaceae bacterium]
MRAEKPLEQREIEHKFRVNGLFTLPDLGGVVGSVEPRGTAELSSTYYDTADLRLARESIALRRRTGGYDDGWHLKLPVSATTPGVRDEIHVPLEPGSDDGPPDALVSYVRAVVRRAPLVPVASLRTRRTIYVLRDADGAQVAELVDDSVQVTGADGKVSSRFRELELEERAGASSEIIEKISRVLTDAGAVGGEFVAKVTRALGSEATAPPEVPGHEFPRPKDPARPAIAAYLARHTRDLRAADLAVRRDAEDAVHQLRVAARRLRSGLRVFRPLLDRDWANRLRDELRWFASSLGRYRDTEVLLSRLAPGRPTAAEPGRQVLRDRLTERMSEARTDALEVMESPRYLALHEALVAACASPVTTEDAELPCREVLPPLVAKAWRKFAAEVEALLSSESATPEGAPDSRWHQVRIAAKRVRYAAEAVAPVLGKDAARFARQMAKVTEVLGDHQDAAQAAAIAEEFATSADAELAFALGVLCGAERAHVGSARARFAALWPKVNKEKLRRWFET